jgi:hypothetical protein
MPEPLIKIAAKTAEEIVALAGLSEEARALLQAGDSPAVYLDRLIGGQQFPDAIRFLCRALPPRQAIWWACQAVRRAWPDPAPPVANALQSVERWVADPQDANRRAAFAAGEQAGMDTPAGLLATAVFFSGGSIAAPGSPTVPPPENVAAQLSAGALMIAATAGEPEKVADQYREFLSGGIKIASGAVG